MAIENWIDTFCERFAVAAGSRGTVRSYVYYKRAELPGKPDQYPCAITLPERVKILHSAGGPNVDLWIGRTEFHLWPDVGFDKLPDVCLYQTRIAAAMDGAITLGGLVANVDYDPQRPDLLIPAQLRWAEEDPWHWGAVVYWQVKEVVTATVAA
jgi:hypothetical protein